MRLVDEKCLGFVREERQNLSWLNSANLHALQAVVLAAEDSNSGFRRFQKCREIFDNSFVCSIFDGRCLNSQLQRAFDDAGDFIAAGARLYADRKYDAAIFGCDVELLPGLGRSRSRGWI